MTPTKKIKSLDSRISKFLEKKITLAAVLWICTVELVIFLIILSRKVEYSYVDTNGHAGTSPNCYYEMTAKELRCDVPTKVQQYYKK